MIRACVARIRLSMFHCNETFPRHQGPAAKQPSSNLVIARHPLDKVPGFVDPRLLEHLALVITLMKAVGDCEISD